MAFINFGVLQEKWIRFRYSQPAMGCTPHKKRYKTGRGGPEQEETLLIATDIFDLEADVIACMLLSLWTGRKPTLRTYEMLCWYFTGMADEEELPAHITRLQKQD
ncbi:MAG: hypothetical protein DRP65_09935 [Planctomycetota bacterium]|nr:MAG: hypothetical protein DRP65_09935 [Planctomycetota bacterium]